MIDLYAWPTPNGYKISVMLEEVGLPYRTIPVDITKGDQFKPDFLKISPNNRMPAIVDAQGPDGMPVSVFESGAILIYLAEKTGQLMGKGPRGRIKALEWLMFQMGGVGPMLGQAHHFRLYAPEKIPYAIDRYTNEAGRLYGVLDRRLSEAEYLADEYSIADIAVFPWIRPWKRQGQNLDDFPQVKRWLAAIKARAAVQRGLQLLSDHLRKPEQLSDADRDVLFGATQFARR